jgi:diguanylate cyclase (GGDEF)-like protein/PAS domain S-box-containing protein
MIRPPRLSLSLPQRIVIVSFSLFVIVALLTALFARQAVREELNALHEQAAHLPALAAPALQAFSENRPSAFQARLRELAESQPVSELRLTDTDGRSLFRHARAAQPLTWWTGLWVSDTDREVRASVMLDARSHATLTAVLASGALENAAWRMLALGAAFAATIALVLTGLAIRLRTQLTAPLRSLTAWCLQLARGKPAAVPAAQPRYREVRELTDALAQSAIALNHHRLQSEEARDLLEHSEGRLRQLVDTMHEVLVELDSHGRLRYLNPAWTRFTGFTVEQSLNRPFADFLANPENHEPFDVTRLPRLPEGGRELALRHREGRPIWARIEAETRVDSQGRAVGLVGTLSDITQRTELSRLLDRHQSEIHELSMIDPLTGLHNRRHFEAQLDAILAEHHASNRPVCLLLIDLDGFKFINDIYGHPLGDEALRTTARLLKEQIREQDYVARLAGDEFALVLRNTDLPAAMAIAQKVHATIAATRVALPLGGMPLQSSIGVAESPTHGRRPAELMSAADVALYHSKRQGRNRVESLSPDASQATKSVFSQGFALRQALEHGYMRPAFQPIYDIHNGREVAREVLARMRLPDSIVHAKDFIAVAEELGLTRELDLHIIHQALTLTPADQALFLNVDLSSFNDRAFVNELVALLAPARAAGRPITIEITERETVPISDTLLEDVQRLRALGCKLALDDFGSGYSTYYFLDQFRPDYLKIEGTFVRAMLESESARKIVMHIHELAQSFGMETIAENVENEAIRSALAEIGIRKVQGWLYGEPQLAA